MKFQKDTIKSKSCFHFYYTIIIYPSYGITYHLNAGISDIQSSLYIAIYSYLHYIIYIYIHMCVYIYIYLFVTICIICYALRLFPC